MKYPIETTLNEILNRINDVCKKNRINKEYQLYFKDQKIPTYLRTDKFKEGVTEKDNIDNGGLVSGDLRYGVHLYLDAVYPSTDITSTEKTKITIFHQSYLCKDYSEYLKGKYKLTMLNVLLYEFILIGMINMEAEIKLKQQAKDDKAKNTPVKEKEVVPVMSK